MSVQILTGDCREVLRGLPGESVHCVVTSPPYWGLRDYNVAGQLGLEPTLGEHIDVMVEVFREVRRVLRKDGTVWLNYGDCYATTNGRSAANTKALGNDDRTFRDKPFSTVGPVYDPNYRKRTTGGIHAERRPDSGGRVVAGGILKSKDLCMMPARVALALQADGWWLRSEIIWCLSGGAWLYARTQKGTAPMMLKDLVRLDPITVELWTGERWTNVTAWTKREGRTDAHEIVLRSGERFGCTGEHLWPTQRGDVRTDELRKRDRIKTAKLPSGGEKSGWLDRDAFWFAGLYLAEGSRSGDTIQLTGHIREIARWDRIQVLAAHYGASARLYQHGKTQNIHIDRAAALNAILSTLIGGRTAKDKHLTNAVWGYRDWALKLIAEGYLEGDGHDDGNRIRLGFTRNYALERDLRCLAARLGATITLKPGFSKIKEQRFPSFRGEWRWARSGHHNERDRGEVMEIRRSRARQFWDVTVADSSSLFALSSGVLSHNSKPNPMPESITDRPTSAHEKIYLLAKCERYFFDAEAVREEGEGRLDRWEAGRGRLHSGSPWKAEPLTEPNGRNIRNVWTIATAPFPQAHFATFPPALVEPCIKAGTSLRGCCPECGAPWVREVERTDETRDDFKGSAFDRGKTGAGDGGDRTQGGERHKTRLTGWRPSCGCGLAEGPCTVLDPFAGAGTVGLVADRLKRNAILIELNPDYAAMARERIQADGGMFAEVSAA